MENFFLKRLLFLASRIEPEILLLLLLLFLREFLFDLRTHFYSFSCFSVGDIKSFGQLSEIFVDMNLEKRNEEFRF